MAEPLKPGGMVPRPQGRGTTQGISLSDFDFARNMSAKVASAQTQPELNSVVSYNYQTKTFDPSLNESLGIRNDLPMAYLDPSSGYNQKNFATWFGQDNKDPNFVANMSEEELLGYTRGVDSYGDTDLGPAQGNWDIPTSTSNFKRPRTVAAGYDRSQQLLTVVFRDGTFWNYYDVSNDEWIKFHNSYSKGELINKGGSIYENHRGDATDTSSMSPEAQKFFVAVSRTAQIAFRDGPVKRGSKTGSQPLRSKNKRIKSEYDKQRRARIKANQSAAASAAAGKNPSKNGKNPFKG